VRREELRDCAKRLLLEIAAEIRALAKEAPGADWSSAPGVTEIAREHAYARLSQGFELPELIAEYRALRASVVRMCKAEIAGNDVRQAVDSLMRFHDAIDQARTEAVTCYHGRLVQARELLLGILGHDLRVPLNAIAARAAYSSTLPRSTPLRKRLSSTSWRAPNEWAG
jgi:hypothetical protein